MKMKVLFALMVLSIGLFLSGCVSNDTPTPPPLPEEKTIRLQEEARTATIYKGWNLFPVNMTSDESDCENNWGAVYIYSPLESKYLGGNVVNGQLEQSAQNEVYNYNPRYANYASTHFIPGSTGTTIWFYAKQNCSIKSRNNQDIQNLIPTHQKKLFAGWNFITVMPSMLGLSPKEIFANCNVSKFYTWSPWDQKWQKIPDTATNTTTLSENQDNVVGLPLVVKVQNECMLSGASVPQLPSLPE